MSKVKKKSTLGGKYLQDINFIRMEVKDMAKNGKMFMRGVYLYHVYDE